MVKSMVFSSVVVMLLSSAAMALAPAVPSMPGVIFNYEDFAVGSANGLILSGASGMAFNTNTATIIQNQGICKPCSDAHQDTVGIFVQDAYACGDCGGTWTVGQIALLGGAQMQLVGDGCGPKTQGQGLAVDLLQDVTKVDGTGQANANHTVAVVQNQNANNSAGPMTESNVVLAGQVSGVTGGPATSAATTSGLIIQTDQVQAAL